MLVTDGSASLAATGFSHCGKYFAYGISLSGSDFFTIYVRETSKPLDKRPEKSFVEDPDRLPDVIRFVKFSGITWTHDSKGFFYQVRGRYTRRVDIMLMNGLNQRYPTRSEHGSLDSDQAGTETVEDKNAMLYYHRLGTDQCEEVSLEACTTQLIH